ncbi:hypothetical protein MIND_00441500 [Mycena indigotica]|uniref:von Willebrand domain-containing protein n=1 Tax=Mycena indigotica TaxID=2126181 RepID=A0A8H6SX95_9AGAR|nr:uncharacterized protein MIND_00441500 [Mycena indigotica]KAF7306502.1 hypothetical protein MIND_00441500 [Mycena indigotica]
MPPQQGVVHSNGDDTGASKSYLALQEMRAKVMVVDLSARVHLTQIFYNPLPTATSRATYFFPVPASGAVCGFELKTSDNRTVKAVCKGKSRAREEYEQAIAEGKESSLLEWVEDDIFTISVGSIPANATISTTLVYVLTLPNDANTDEVRFQLPMCVGERYGPPLPALVGAAAPSSSTRIRITMEIQTNGTIQSITSPSHQITQSAHKKSSNRPSRRRITVKYRSHSYLENDFVVVVRADGLDDPRCFAELQRDPTGRHSDTVAMQITLVPRFKLQTVVGQEYIFLVDRSGSMAGGRIETAKRTLNLLLRMLPTKGSSLNIFSFGSHCDSLWPTSQAYNQSFLETASTYVKAMDSNYGGTEIRTALEAVFASRNSSSSTAVFVLTDGDVTDQQSVIHTIQQAVRQSKSNGSRHSLRVFCLGIGDGVSSAMCEGIARAGNGVCLFAVHTESIVGKCAALFHAGRKSFVHNVSVDWGVPDENLSQRSTVNFSTPRSSPSKVLLRPAPAIQQSPVHIEDLHAGSRINIYAILTLRKVVVPKQVVVRGESDDGTPFELPIPLRGIQLESRAPLIHTLAAWKLVQDHQERTQPLALVVAPFDAPPAEEEIRKASIVRLGERYQIASRQTSFVAVDDGVENSRRKKRAPTSSRPTTAVRTKTTATPSVDPVIGWRDLFYRFFTLPEADPDETESQLAVDIPGSWQSDVTSDPVTSEDDSEDGYESTESFSTISSFEGRSSGWSTWTEEPEPPISEEDAQKMQHPSPKLEPVSLAPESTRVSRRRELEMIKPPPVILPPPPPIDPQIVQLVELQLFDGSFNETIQTVLGEHVLKVAEGLNLDAKLWTTAVSIAFLGQRLAHPGHKELLEDLVEKAYSFLYLNGWDERTVKRVVKAAIDVL